MPERDDYLGDGLYVSWDGYVISLTADKGSPAERTVYLEDGTYAALVRFAATVGWGNLGR